MAKYESKKNKGFTLVEILVSIAIFTIFISAVMEFFVSALKNQLRTLERQSLLDSVSYSVDYTARALRMAKKDLSGNCITSGFNFKNPEGNPLVIRFLNAHGKCQEFLLQNNQLQVELSSDNSSANLASPEPLTSSKIVVNSLNFRAWGASQNDNLQPKVTFVMNISTKEQKPQILKIQTTVSQRDLDIQY